MKALRKKRRMISLPLLALLLSSAGIFYGGMWVSEKTRKVVRTACRRQNFLPRRNSLPNCRNGWRPAQAPGSIRPWPDLRNADEAMRTAETHIRESEMAAQKAARV